MNDVYKAILDANIRSEQAEVVLKNLLASTNDEEQKFNVPFEDVKVILNLAIRLIEN